MSQPHTHIVKHHINKPHFLTFLFQLACLIMFSILTSASFAHEKKSADTHNMDELPVVDLRQVSSLNSILEQTRDARLLLVGETHTRYDHHLIQLAVLKYLYQNSPDVALGVEWFQQPFQQHLDDYIAGRITESEMLHRTEYYERWRFDYRLYRPIIQYAREKQIPIIALNASRELTSALGKGGFDELPAELLSQLPDSYDFTDTDYVGRLKHIFSMHPDQSGKFESFLRVQFTWDESMASRAAEYLRQHPDKKMLVLAGSGHIIYGSGIPNRVKRRLDARQFSILVSDETLTVSHDMADFLVLSAQQNLKPAGLLGAFLETANDRVVIKEFSDGSAIKDAGIEKGAIIVGINDEPIKSYTDLKLALIDRLQGDTVELHYLENGSDRKSKKITLR